MQPQNGLLLKVALHVVHKDGIFTVHPQTYTTAQGQHSSEYTVCVLCSLPATHHYGTHVCTRSSHASTKTLKFWIVDGAHLAVVSTAVSPCPVLSPVLYGVPSSALLVGGHLSWGDLARGWPNGVSK